MVVRIQFRPDQLTDYQSTLLVTPCPTCSARPITVTNTSKAPLAVKTLTLSGSPDLTAALDGGALPRTLGPGETVAGTARYQPRNLGLQQAQASLQAVEGGPGILSMSGAGTGPWLQMKPKSLFVGPAAIGTTRTSTVTATNVGYDPARAAPLALTAVYLGKNDGTWSVQSGARSVGAPGASVDIAVSFSPATPGFSQATLVIESNDALHPRVEVPLSAIGRDLLPCALEVTPASPVNFGLQKLFTRVVGGFELANRTSDDCIVGEPSIVSGAPAFRWPGGIVPAGRTLPPGGRMSVRLEFLAEQAQTYSGAVRFYLSNRSAPSMTVDLVGAGDSSCFFVTPATVDFGPTLMGCGIPNQFTYAVNWCSFPVTVTRVETIGAYFSSAAALPIRIDPNPNAALPIGYAPPSAGDDVGAIQVFTDMRQEPFQAGITGGAQVSATIVDQWDQGTPKVDLLIVIDNSGSMAEEQKALAQNLDRLWNRIALANADYHIAVTTTGMFPYTSGFMQCPGGASGGEAGRCFPVDNSAPVSDYVRRLAQVKHGALDLIAFAGIVPLHACASAEGVATRYMEIGRQLNGHLEDVCDLANFGPMLESSLGGLLLPLTSFPLSARPRDPSQIVVTVGGVTVTVRSCDPVSNRIVFPATAVPPPGSHITAKYEPA